MAKIDGETDVLEDNDQAAQADIFLQILVQQVNRGYFTMDITLCIGGGLISGHLISGESYYELFAQDLAGGAHTAEQKEFVKPLQEAIADIGHQTYTSADRADDPVEPEPLPQFVHLQDARMILGGMVSPSVGNRGVLWRGRLAAVDGFWLGSLAFGQR